MAATNFIKTNRLVRWCSKFGLNIPITQQILSGLVVRKRISNACDLFTLNASDFMLVRGVTLEKAKLLESTVRQSRHVPFERFVFALSIPYVTVDDAVHIAQAAKDYRGLVYLLSCDAGLKILEKVLGKKGISSSVMRWYELNGKEFLDQLHPFLDGSGQMIFLEFDAKQLDLSIQDRTFHLSGYIPGYTHKSLKAAIEQRGGFVRTSLSKSVDVVIAGTGSYFTGRGVRPYDIWNAKHLEEALEQASALEPS